MKTKNCVKCNLPMSVIGPTDKLLKIGLADHTNWFPKGKDTEVIICKNSGCKDYSWFIADAWWQYKRIFMMGDMER